MQNSKTTKKKKKSHGKFLAPKQLKLYLEKWDINKKNDMIQIEKKIINEELQDSTALIFK